MRVTTQDHPRAPPQLQAPASIQINIPWTVLSISFFITTFCTTYRLALSSHYNRSSHSLPLAKTRTCISDNNNKK